MKSRNLGKAIVAAVAFTALGVFATPAGAADKGGAKADPSMLGNMQPTRTHAGCGAGASLGWVNGQLELPGPIDIGSTGSRIGGRLLCDWQYQAFIIGLFVDYDRQFGDIKTIGVRDEWGVGGKLGLAVSQSASLYTHAGWYRVDGTFGHVDGLGYGVGSTLKLAGSPFELDLRWTHKTYDNVLGSTLDVTADEFKATLVYKINFLK